VPDFWMDADAFITPSLKYYALDIAPGFWSFIIEQAKNGVISSPIEVYNELERNGKDPLQNWIRPQKDTKLFTRQDKSVSDRYAEIADYVMQHDVYTMPNKLKFLSGADGWLIAHASQYGGKVITLEVPAPDGTYVKIPDLCNQFRVKYGTPWDMRRSLGFCLR
jgi:hypothetical protein